MTDKPRFRDRFRRMFKSESGSSKETTQVPPRNQPQPTPETSNQPSIPQNAEPAPSNPPPATNPPPEDDDDGGPPPSDFRLRVHKNFWSFFDHSEGSSPMAATGNMFYDFVHGIHGKWGGGAQYPPDFFGNRIFDPSWLPDETHRVPPRLYDLAQRQTVETALLGPVRYAAVSHVWGSTQTVKGADYGVPWDIPMRNAEKLEQIFEAARIAVGERYIWMDVLCLDQSVVDRHDRQGEIAKMGEYYRNATGCLVWFDNTYDDAPWTDVLKAFRAINSFFKLDEYNMPNVPVEQIFGPNASASLIDRDFSPADGFKWARQILTVEKAPWFRRVWTLQEGVIPKTIFFCTPERYMTSCATFLQAVGLCEMIAKALMEAGAMESLAIMQELQQSELYKMLKLRQLYDKEQVSFWHIAQAVRSRECSVEQDRVIGVSGMLQKSHPVIDYRMKVSSLWGELYEQAVYEGDFSPLLYLGDRLSYVSMFPDMEVSMGFIALGDSHATSGKETHRLKLIDEGIEMEGVGFDKVVQVVNIMATTTEGPLFEWGKQSPEFLDMGTEAHKAVATAWGLPADTVKVGEGDIVGEFVVGAWAAYGSMSGAMNNPALIDPFGPDFASGFRRLVPRGLWHWIRVMHLAQGHSGCALVLVWTASSEVQLALITEPLEGQVVVVTPSSYKEHPGSGCLVCKRLPNGGLRKIGLGLGKSVKASLIGSCVVERTT